MHINNPDRQFWHKYKLKSRYKKGNRHCEAKAAFSMGEMLVVLLIIGIISAATTPMMTQMAQIKTGIDPHAMKCILSDASGITIDGGTGDSTMPPDETECYYAVTNAHYGMGNVLKTVEWRASHGSTPEQKTAAKKILRTACDLGGEKACDYFINECMTGGGSGPLYCDDKDSFLDITYYLKQPAETINAGAIYVENKVRGLLPHMRQSLLQEVFKNCDEEPESVSCGLLLEWIYIKGCNLGYEEACKMAYDKGWNTSCTAVKTYWPEAPTGNYRLTSQGDPDPEIGEGTPPQTVNCNMSSMATAAITGCNAYPAVSGDCIAGFSNNYNRTCQQLFTEWPSIGCDNYNLTTNGLYPDNPLEEEYCCNKPPGTWCLQEVGRECDDGTIYAGRYNDYYYFTTHNDETGKYIWGPNDYDIPGVLNENDGQANVNDVLADKGISITDLKAVRACKTKNDNVANGHSDWYLPAKNELDHLYKNRAAIGNFANDYYWSSTETEYGSTSAWGQGFNTAGTQNRITKTYSYRVRCVRRTQ